jgi:Asp-tRNA(Asn)/Glu-tRNA(Gln) amidotransferase A subunit family amidase
MGPLMKAMKKMARPLSFDEYASAWVARDLLRASVVGEMTERPIIVAPVAAIPAFPHDQRGGFQVEGKAVEYLHVFSYAQTYNVLGLPAAVVPCGRSPEGLPIGVQIVGRPYEEEAVLSVAAALEDALGGFQPPPL